jgi:hypothetical protein
MVVGVRLWSGGGGDMSVGARRDVPVRAEWEEIGVVMWWGAVGLCYIASTPRDVILADWRVATAGVCGLWICAVGQFFCFL